MGDYSKQKFILGRKVDKEIANSEFTLKQPLDNFVKLQECIDEKFTAHSYAANATDVESQSALHSEAGAAWRTFYHWTNTHPDTPTPATKLALSIDLRTLLGEYRPKRGNYGVLINIKGKSKPTNEKQSSDISVQGKFAANRDMYGNPYAYYFTYNHQKVFDISNFLSISSIDLQFYQDETFVDEFGDQIPITLPSGELGKVGYRNGVDNIFIDGVEVFLGLEADEIGKEKVICYTYDDVIYGKDPLSTVDRNKADKRTLQVAWVHQLDTDKYTVIDKDDKNGLSKYEGYHIYWYRQNWEEVNEQLQQAPDNLRGRNWEYLKGYDDQFTIDVVNNISRNKEQYCAIVWSSDTKEISNVLEFKNQIDIDNTNNLLKSDDALCFRIFKTANDGKELIQDDTLFNFYCYDELNKCTFTNDGGLWSNYWYYIQVYIKDPETLKYKPLRLDDNDNIVVIWKSPLDAEKTNMVAKLYGGGTMFQDFAELTEAEDSAYLKDLNADTIVDANTFTRKFKIKPEYNFRYNNNLIIASFTRNGINYSLSRQFNFGNAASMGSKYSVEILMDNPLGYVVSGKDCQLHVVIRNEEGKDVTRENVSNISWTVYPNTYNCEKDGGVILLTNTDQWKMHPPIIKCKVINVAPYPLEVVKGINVKDNKINVTDPITHKNYYLTSIVPDRIEYKSDGTIPRYSTGDFIIQQSESEDTIGDHELQMISDYEKITYDISHFICENGKWTEDKENEKSILSIIKSSSSQEIEEKKESNEEEKKESKESDKAIIIQTEKGKFSYNIPRYRLSLKNLTAENNSEWYWEDKLQENNIYRINTYYDKQLLYSQSVAFDRNLYSSSLVNSWNSDELSLDEKNNAILAKMIGAGTKDAYNRFTGVLMGDFTDKSDGSIRTGITGFRNGSQSFGFKTDGTGFIGEAGAGQITFDGNRAKISSSDGNFYINLNPTRAIQSIADNGQEYLDASNYKSSDQFFLYSKIAKSSTKKNTTATTMNDSGWYTKFVEDANNDYFIVDPANGMFLSGGIIATYGKLGNWTINEQGMYQKNKEANKYMFLGYNPSASDSSQTDNDTYAIFAGENEYVNPVFSVSWSGVLRARKGGFGSYHTGTKDKEYSVWEISDEGLTNYGKNGIIHLGSGLINSVCESGDTDVGKAAEYYNNPDIKKQFFYTKVVKDGTVFPIGNIKDKTTSEYQIFAADINNQINFGVSFNGKLLSRLGIIGGWNITNDTLQAGNIVLNSTDNTFTIGPNNAIIIKGDTGEIIINALKDNITQGSIQLGSYELRGRSQVEIASSYTTDPGTAVTSADGTQADSQDAAYNAIAFDQITLKCMKITSRTKNTITLTSNSSLTFLNGNIGICLVSGKGQVTMEEFKIIKDELVDTTKTPTPTEENVTIFYPNQSGNFNYLGTADNRWNVLGQYINAHAIETDTLSVLNDSIYMQGEKVATEKWVYNCLNDVYNSIKGVGDTAAKAVTGASKGITSLGQAITNAFVNSAYVSGVKPVKSGNTLSIYTQGYTISLGEKSIHGLSLTRDLKPWFDSTKTSVNIIDSVTINDNGSALFSVSVNGVCSNVFNVASKVTLKLNSDTHTVEAYWDGGSKPFKTCSVQSEYDAGKEAGSPTYVGELKYDNTVKSKGGSYYLDRGVWYQNAWIKYKLKEKKDYENEF